MTVEVKAESESESTHVEEVVSTQMEVVETEIECKKVDESNLRAVEKSSSFKEESNFLSDLKDNEKKALSELKCKLEEAILGNNLFKKQEDLHKEKAEESVVEGEVKEEKKTEETEQKCQEEKVPNLYVEVDEDISLWGAPLLTSKATESTDVVLLKFLRAREFKVNEAFEMLKKTLQWRKDMKIDSILDEDLGTGLALAAYMSGADREGHPICYNIFGVLDDEELYQKTFGTEEKRGQFLRWRFQLMEKGIKKLDLKPGCVTSLLQVNDLKNSPGPTRKELRGALKQAVGVLQDNYPEFVARNIFINVPFWYYAFHALLSPFLTHRTKSKFVVVRPNKVTDTLIKHIPIEEIPTQYGGLKRENDFEFSNEDGVSELVIRAGSTAIIEIPAPQAGTTFIWDLSVLGWEVNYKEEFVPTDECSYTIIIQKGKKVGSNERTIRNSYTTNEPGKIVLTVDNSLSKKIRVFYRYKVKKSC